MGDSYGFGDVHFQKAKEAYSSRSEVRLILCKNKSRRGQPVRSMRSWVQIYVRSVLYLVFVASAASTKC